MKILLEGPERIELVPENEHEKENLNSLWKLLIRCEGHSKVMCPIGEYNPVEDEGAQFTVQDQFPGAEH